jgi:predicted transcriptional regulator
MRTHKWRDVRARKLPADELEKIDREVAREVLEMDLRELRELAGLTQAELAEKIDVNQATVSKLEREQFEARLAAIKRVVEALGGELEVTAVIKGKRVRLAVA